MLILVVAVSAGLLAAACGSSASPVPTPITPTATSPVPTPALAAAAAPSPSPMVAAPAPSAAPAGGTSAALDLPTLGGTREAWVRAKGSPTRSGRGEMFDESIAVTFSAPTGGVERATSIEVQLGHETGLSRGGIPAAEARDLARPLHPPDARAVRTYTDAQNQTVEVFESGLLAAAFGGASQPAPGGGSFFGDQPPGTYAQIAERGSPTTNRVELSVGRRP